MKIDDDHYLIAACPSCDCEAEIRKDKYGLYGWCDDCRCQAALLVNGMWVGQISAPKELSKEHI